MPLIRLRLTVASLLVLALLLTWQFGWRSDTEVISSTDPQQRIDWYVEGAVLTRYDEEGIRLSVTDALEIIHFEGKKLSELQQPYTVGYSTDQNVDHTLSAKQALYLDDNSRIDLMGKVELHLNPASEKAVAMFTPTLTYFPERELAVTGDPVEIDSNSGVTRAVGMEYYIAEQRMELLKQVRGNYVATESK